MTARTWALTAYFNPAGSAARPAAYDVFRRALARQGVPLLAVEAAFGDAPFALDDGDADLVHRVRGGSALWQKERLLNLGLARLPDGCENVVWIDADVVFLDETWTARTEALLASYAIVQPFERAVRLGRRDTLEAAASLASTRAQPGFAFAAAEAGRAAAVYQSEGGFAWAAKRRLLEDIGFYDRAVVGGGDWVMNRAFADLDEPDPAAAAWSLRARRAVNGRMTAAPGTVAHLFHGFTWERRYGLRREILERHGFDPDADLRVGPSGLWEWATEKPDLHRDVRDLFTARNDDGRLWRSAAGFTGAAWDALRRAWRRR